MSSGEFAKYIQGWRVKLVDCEPRRHSAAILAIFNEAIANSTAHLRLRSAATAESMVSWFDAKAKGHYPVIGFENDAGELAGFRAATESFATGPPTSTPSSTPSMSTRGFAARGCGRALLEAIVAAAVRQDYHVMVGGIDASNAVSIRLHESLGFTHCGTVAQAGLQVRAVAGSRVLPEDPRHARRLPSTADSQRL